MTQLEHAQRLQQIFDLSQVHAVITGGGSGIGLNIGIALASVGATVTLIDVNEERLQAAKEEHRDSGFDVHVKNVDITDHNEYDRAMSEIAETKPITAVFANAGISAGQGPKFEVGKLENIDPDKWDAVLNVNLTGVMNTMALAAKYIPDNSNGRVVVTSSLAGVRADPLVGYAYVASKTAVLGLVRNAALELAPRGITVNAFAPGLFETNIRKANPAAEAMTEAFAKMSAVGRPGRLEELDGMAVFLASPASSYLTGATINLDGGGQHVGPNT